MTAGAPFDVSPLVRDRRLLVDEHWSIGRFLQQFRAELFDEFGTGLDGNFGSQQLLLLSSSPRCLRRVTQLGDDGSFGALRL